MGPFPHDAPPATITAANPAGTDGFEFVEFAHTEPAVIPSASLARPPASPTQSSANTATSAPRKP